jgi:uncharacterized protein (DUF433 family)
MVENEAWCRSRESNLTRPRLRPFKASILCVEAPMLGFDRITFDPDILGGKACIRGMRISVSLVVNLVANGMTAQEIIAEYPDLEEQDVAQALQYPR